MRGTTLICVLVIRTLAAFAFLPTSAQDTEGCQDQSDCTNEEVCLFIGVRKDAGNCLKRAKEDERCSKLIVDVDVLDVDYMSFPPCEEDLTCKASLFGDEARSFIATRFNTESRIKPEDDPTEDRAYFRIGWAPIGYCRKT